MNVSLRHRHYEDDAPNETMLRAQPPLIGWQRSLGNATTLVLGFVVGVHLATGSYGQDLRLAKQVDHIIIRVDDPDPLFSLLSETLELPVAWPLKSYGFFRSGGVFAGNVNVEVLRMGPRIDAAPDKSPDARLSGIAFEPHDSIEAGIRILDARKLLHGPPMPFASVGREGGALDECLATGASSARLDDLPMRVRVGRGRTTRTVAQAASDTYRRAARSAEC